MDVPFRQVADSRIDADDECVANDELAALRQCCRCGGTGLRRGVFWRDMGVVNLRGGKPSMALTGGAAARLAEITPAGMTSQIDLTITDEYPLAQAFVIISANPAA